MIIKIIVKDENINVYNLTNKLIKHLNYSIINEQHSDL